MFPPLQNVNQKILTLHGFCFIIIIFSQQLYHQGLTEGGKNQAVLKEKGKKQKNNNPPASLSVLFSIIWQDNSTSAALAQRISPGDCIFPGPLRHPPTRRPSNPTPTPTPAAFLLPFWPSAWPISVRPLSCAILSVLASCYSRVALLPVSRLLLLPLTSPLDSFCMLSKPPPLKPRVPLREPVPLTLPLPGNSLPFCFFSSSSFFGYFWGSTFSFHLAARPPFLLQGHIM